jgi:hypothetical protein
VFGPLGGGSHSYTIQSADSSGSAATPYSSTFTVVGSPVAISTVVIAEATPQNARLESNEQLVVTWGVTSVNPITSQSVKIDNVAKTPIYGPYGIYYADVFGPLTAGTHSYSIQTIDNKGNVGNASGSFTVLSPSALMLAAAAPSSIAKGVTEGDSPILADAEIGAVGKTVDSDRDAAGYGWFADPTPADDGEFADLLGAHTLAARKESPTANRVDLLTTVMHELGHVLGYDDVTVADDLMSVMLPLGTRCDAGSVCPTAS